VECLEKRDSSAAVSPGLVPAAGWCAARDSELSVHSRPEVAILTAQPSGMARSEDLRVGSRTVCATGLAGVYLES
jgi:hypothetical protein